MTKTLTERDRKRQKKKSYARILKKRDLILAAYRKTGGSIIDISRATGVSRGHIYRIFDRYPKMREEIDSLDVARIEGLKDKALAKLEENIDDGLQKAIEYALEKEPRKERGKIVVNKDEFKGPDYELIIGVNQKVIIE